MYFLQPCIHAFSTTTSLVADDEDFLEAHFACEDEERRTSEGALALPLWMHIFRPLPLLRINSDAFSITYLSLHVLDAGLFPISLSGVKNKSNMIESGLETAQCYSSDSLTTQLFPNLDSFFPNALHEARFLSTFASIPSAATSFSTDVSPTSANAISIAASALLVTLVRLLQTCCLVDQASQTGDGSRQIAEEAAFHRGEITQDELQVMGERKVCAVNRSPRGFKVDIIRTLANIASIAGTTTLSLLGAASTLELCLSLSRMDPHNSFSREWSILATKNLTERHFGNQSRIAALSFEGVEHNNQLKKLGLDTWNEDGKVKIGSKAPIAEEQAGDEDIEEMISSDGTQISSVDSMLEELKEEYNINVDYDFM